MSLSIEHALLGFLRQGPRHGYAIHQVLADPAGLGGVWQIKLSRLYALLGKLEEAGYVAASTEPQENKPPRKLFRLTESGTAAFLNWLNRPVEHGRNLRLEFLVKLYFAGREEDNLVPGLLDAQREQCRAWLTAEQARADREDARDRPFVLLVHRFRLGQIQAMLSWLDRCEEVYLG